MALTLNPSTRLITIPQADLTFISGTLWVLDTNQFRKNVFDLLASEPYIWMPDAFAHNGEVSVAGTTYARTLEFINSYSCQFEFTGSQYSVRLEGSNNNMFDVENGILVPTSLVTVIPTNSAGLISVTSGSGVTAQDKTDIKNLIFAEIMEGTETFKQQQIIQRAGLAGRIVANADGTYSIRDLADSKDRIEGHRTANGGRDSDSVDGT